MRFQHIGHKRRIFHNPLHLFRLFCSLLSDICSHTRLCQTTLILFIQISTIVINGTILSCLLRVKNIRVNQPTPPLNDLRMFTRNHMEYFYIGDLVKGGKMKERQNIFFVHGYLRMVNIGGKSINNIYYLSYFYD